MKPVARAIIRLILIFFTVILYGIALTLWKGRGPHGVKRIAKIRQRWFARSLKRVGVKVHQQGEPLVGAGMVVANHVSWLDISILGQAVDVRFLSKDEVGRWPLIGWLARRNGTLFIRRGGHEGERIMQNITQALQQGERVAWFPEATTSNGQGVLRFHPRLFAPAIAAGVPVQPVAIAFRPQPDGSPSRAPFVHGDRLLPHMWNVLKAEHIEATIQFLPPIPVTEDMQRRALAEQARLAIVHALGVPVEPPQAPTIPTSGPQSRVQP